MSGTTITLSTELLREARVPVNHWRLGVDTFPGSKQSLTLLKRYLKRHAECHRRGIGLVFYGEQLTCKTFLAGFALRYLLANGWDCFYLTLRELTDAMMSRGGEFNVLERLRNADFFVIDQIGHDPNEGEIQCLKEAIKTRTSQLLPTFFALDMEIDPAENVTFEGIYGSESHNYLAEFNEPVECQMSEKRANRLRLSRFAGVF